MRFLRSVWQVGLVGGLCFIAAVVGHAQEEGRGAAESTGLAKAATQLNGRQGFEIDAYTIDGGGGNSSGDYLHLSGIIGQPDVGAQMGGEYHFSGGFWRDPESVLFADGFENGDASAWGN